MPIEQFRLKRLLDALDRILESRSMIKLALQTELKALENHEQSATETFNNIGLITHNIGEDPTEITKIILEEQLKYKYTVTKNKSAKTRMQRYRARLAGGYPKDTAAGVFYQETLAAAKAQQPEASKEIDLDETFGTSANVREQKRQTPNLASDSLGESEESILDSALRANYKPKKVDRRDVEYESEHMLRELDILNGKIPDDNPSEEMTKFFLSEVKKETE